LNDGWLLNCFKNGCVLLRKIMRLNYEKRTSGWRNNGVVYQSYKHINADGFELNKEIIMWTKPAATEMRFGFEVTMYVMNK